MCSDVSYLSLTDEQYAALKHRQSQPRAAISAAFSGSPVGLVVVDDAYTVN